MAASVSGSTYYPRLALEIRKMMVMMGVTKMLRSQQQQSHQQSLQIQLTHYSPHLRERLHLVIPMPQKEMIGVTASHLLHSTHQTQRSGRPLHSTYSDIPPTQAPTGINVPTYVPTPEPTQVQTLISCRIHLKL